jgi:hypothetical protein
MKDYTMIEQECRETSRISAAVIDEFLLYYAAEKYNLERDLNLKLGKFSHITKKFPKEWVNRLKAQYITHRIFKAEGLIRKILSHPALQKLNQEEIKFLEFQAAHPWKFSFSIIKEIPVDDFYVMEDVFRDEEFLLYSPGITKTRADQTIILWFNLIGFNGSCWQSYGPIGAYRSFKPDDIFFFATEMEPGIAGENDLMIHLESNPVPYMMLLSGANYPLVINKEHQMLLCTAEYEVFHLNPESLSDRFKTEYNKGICRLSLKRWAGPPHFSQAYFKKAERTVVLSAMTDRGFQALVEGFNAYGHVFSDEPDIRIHLTMVTTASDILRKKINLLPYEHLFDKESTPAQKEAIDKLNDLLKVALPEINAGLQPDIKALAKKAGVDPQVAEDVIRHTMERLNKMQP